MDEKLKYRRELIFKVLSWGTIVYLLVLGYAVNQSSLFEMKPAASEEIDLEVKKKRQVEQLNDEAGLSTNSNATKARVEAAKINMEIYKANEERDDAWWRGLGLACGSVIYSLIYFFVVCLIYRGTDPRIWFKKTGSRAADEDVIPFWLALPYALFMGVVTSVAALMTAYR